MAAEPCTSRCPINRDNYIELLIGAVERRRPLWDMQDREYKNVEKKEALCKEVAHEVGCDGKHTLECDSLLILFHRLKSRDLSSLVVEVKKKWKGLKDTFRKKFKESKAGGRSGAGADEIGMMAWKWLKLLMFLSDSVDAGR